MSGKYAQYTLVVCALMTPPVTASAHQPVTQPAAIVWVLVSLDCRVADRCILLQPQPPVMVFNTRESCLSFAFEAAKQGGAYDCRMAQGV